MCQYNPPPNDPPKAVVAFTERPVSDPFSVSGSWPACPQRIHPLMASLEGVRVSRMDYLLLRRRQRTRYIPLVVERIATLPCCASIPFVEAEPNTAVPGLP